jgi:hypothetical protein
MCRSSTLLFAIAMAIAGTAVAAPVAPLSPAGIARGINTSVQSGQPGLILVQNRGRGGGGGGGQRSAQRPAGGGGQRSAAGKGNFNSNDFHRDGANNRNATRNTNVNATRNTNVNANRNVNVSGSGGCCYGGNYNSGPSWGGVAAGVAVGAAVGAMANSTTYAAPPPTYPPGYVEPPPY